MTPIYRIIFWLRMETEQAVTLARLGQGSISAALLFAAEEWEELWYLAASLIEALATGKEYEVFSAAEKMEKNPLVMVSLLETILRDIFIYQQTGDPEAIVMERNQSLCTKFKKLNSRKVIPAMDRINSLKKLYKGTVNSLLLNINISYELMDALQ